MDKRKPTICPEYVRLGENRCTFIRNVEIGIEQGFENLKDLREEYHSRFCAYDSYKNCPYKNKE